MLFSSFRFSNLSACKGAHICHREKDRKEDKTEPGKEFGDFECGQVTGDERKIKDNQGN